MTNNNNTTIMTNNNTTISLCICLSLCMDTPCRTSAATGHLRRRTSAIAHCWEDRQSMSVGECCPLCCPL